MSAIIPSQYIFEDLKQIRMNTITINENGVDVTYEFASFWARVGARMIDGLITCIPATFIPIIVGWLYWSLQHSSERQATVGQNACGIKLLSISGNKIGFGRATGRWFGNFLNVLSCFIGYLMFFFTSKKQCLHDMISNTVVVKKDPMHVNLIKRDISYSE